MRNDQPTARYAEQLKGKTGIRRIINATRYSKDGLIAAWSESAFRQLVLMNFSLVVLAVVLSFDRPTRMVLVAASFVSLIVELLNTGIEAAVDHTSLDKSTLAKRAKDVGSAAQFLAMTLLGLLWLMALWPKHF